MPFFTVPFSFCLVTSLAYLANLITTLVLVVSRAEGYRRIVVAITALLSFLVGPLVAFLSWHWSLYSALKYSSPVSFLFYFVIFGIQLVVFALLGLGIMDGAGGGVFTSIDMIMGGRWLAAALCIICTSLITACFLMGLVVYQQAFATYRAGSNHGAQGAVQGQGRAQGQKLGSTTGFGSGV